MPDKYAPPYAITENILALVAEIGELVGAIHTLDARSANPQLRRDNRVKTIHATLAIENNSLTLEQVTAIVNGRRVLGAPGDIQEVKNAFETYERLLTFDPYSVQDLLHAHALLMEGLVGEAGRFRSGGVGVFAEGRLLHMAPPAAFVPDQVADLLRWAAESRAHPLVKSCVLHYELEFIHPFADGNGRMGRLWQTLLLARWKPLFAWLPVEH
ncbi:MAG: Fic family protein [Oscillospiraceae bacterium]|jgi:Fic family protein|nr:Fic family protein [Oscillospiraceae bacterium]